MRPGSSTALDPPASRVGLVTTSLRIAELTVRIHHPASLRPALVSAAEAPFLGEGVPDVELRVRSGEPRLPSSARRIFDSGALWSLHRSRDGWHIVLRSPAVADTPYRVASMSADFRLGTIVGPAAPPEGSEITGWQRPLGYPLHEVLFLCLLARERGLMVHACGVVDAEQGYLFLGNSGHGKTTLARFFCGRARILNDDRIIIRRRSGRFLMYGTPWHGDHPGVSADGVALDRIFFLHHGLSNQIRQVTGARAAREILTRAFLPLWDEPGLRFTLGFCDRLVSQVPCQHLYFTPSEQVVDFVRCDR